MQNITVSLLIDHYLWFPMVCFFVAGIFIGFAIATILQLIKDKPEIKDVGEKEQQREVGR